MRERLIVLRERRARLLERAADERERLALFVDSTGVLEHWMAIGSRFAAEARRHPAWLMAGAAFVIALRPRRVLSWLVKGWSLYQVYRRGQRLWVRVSPRIAAALKTA